MSTATLAPPEAIEVTVTFLEMSAPPPRYPPAPMGHAVALLRTHDVPRHYYRYLMDRVGRKWHWVNVLRLDEEALDQRLAAPGLDIRVLYLDGAPAGFFEITPRPPKRVELTFFGMMEHAMGKGLGRWFLGQAIEAAWSGGPSLVMVQTCTLDHPAALPLYQKFGFRPVAQAREHVRPLSFEDRSASVMR